MNDLQSTPSMSKQALVERLLVVAVILMGITLCSVCGLLVLVSGSYGWDGGYETATIEEDAGIDPNVDPFDLVEGRWAWDREEDACRDNPHTITISDDESYMNLTYTEPITSFDGTQQSSFRYRIFEQRENYIRAQIEGETRLTDDGDPVVWDLVLTGPDTYCWRRTDWDEATCTSPIVRCD